MVVEEAHNFCPERGFGEAKSSRILRAVASEGRKFGLGMAIVSQRPSRVDKSVLSQCTSQMALQVTNPSDLKAIAASFEGINAETEREIKNLPIGKALLIGASDYPLFVDVRVRKSQHGGRAESFDFSKKVEDVQSHGLSKFLPKLSKTAPKVEVKQEASNMVNIFRPRVTQKDIVMMESKKIVGIDILLHPVLVVNCQVGTEIYQVVFSLNKDKVFALDGKLSWTDLPKKAGNLSPMQRKVFNAVAKKPKITIAELFVETGLGFNEVGGVVDSLKIQGLVKTDGKHVQLVSSSSHMFDLSRLNFLDKPAYAEVAGSKLSVTSSQDGILKLVGYFGAKVTNQKDAYIPFYTIKFEDGSEKTVDGITYSLEI